MPHTNNEHSSGAETVTIVGGGLAGCEAAWQLAIRGIPVRLYEMRPGVMTPAHHSGELGELVCSNSLKSEDPSTAAGLLKSELTALGSLVIAAAKRTKVAAGSALAVDRGEFSRSLTEAAEAHPLIEVVREEVSELPSGRVIVATGPLTSPAFEPALSALVGDARLSFFDAAAPIVDTESIDRSVVFAQSRYDKGGSADYLNAPFTREQYDRFYDALVDARRTTEKEFERRELFQACQPVEEVGRTGRDALRFGALKPVGLTDPRDGSRPWAVVQLRAENQAGTAYNLVGFQTNLTFGEQERVFRLIPGLENAEFLRYGVMHRNTFVDAPRLLEPTLALRDTPSVWMAGQVTGTEGYSEAAASGLLAALNVWASITGAPPVILPVETALGSLIEHATNPETAPYQPMHVNYGIIPPLAERVKGKRERYAAYSERAQAAMSQWLADRPDVFPARDSDG